MIGCGWVIAMVVVCGLESEGEDGGNEDIYPSIYVHIKTYHVIILSKDEAQFVDSREPI
jgi:hypothetical protein